MWHRFGYICRQAMHTIGAQESVAQALDRAAEDPNGDLYGAPLPKRSMPRQLLNRLGHMANRDDALQALNLYQALEVVVPTAMALRFKRTVAYLGYVIGVFYLVSSIYLIQVLPTFIYFMSAVDRPLPPTLLWYLDYRVVLVVGVSVVLLALLFVGHSLKKLFTLDLALQDRFVFKYLYFKGVKRAYLNVVAILEYPIVREQRSTDHQSSRLIDHLDAVDRSALPLAPEMAELMAVQVNRLIASAERQIKTLSVLAYVMILAVIFFYLTSAYSPLFIVGDLI